MMWLIVGLGNPGPRVRRATATMSASWWPTCWPPVPVPGCPGIAGPWPRSVEARLGVGVDAPQLVMAKPLHVHEPVRQPVAALTQFYKIEPAQVVAVHDELDLPYGVVRAKFGGGEGGHNGLRSMSRSLSTKDYLRVRVGIGRPPGRQDPADYVLSDFSAAERKDLDFLVDRAADIVESLVVQGLGADPERFPRGVVSCATPRCPSPGRWV